MLAVAAEGLVDNGHGAGGQSVGDWALDRHTEAVGRATTAIGCYVNKPVKLSLHYEKVNILKYTGSFFWGL